MALGFGKGGSTQTLEMSLTPEQQQSLRGLNQQVGGQIGQGIDPYGGQIAPGTSALQQQGFGALSGQGQQAQGYQSSINRLMAGESAYQADPEARQGVYEAQRQRSMRDFQQNVVPQILEQYNAQGLGRSGGIEQALAGAGGELALRNREYDASLEYQDEESRRRAAEAGAGRQIQGIQGYQSAIEQILGAGAEQRGIQGEQLAEEYQRYEAGQAYNNPWLQYLDAALGTQAYTPTTESSQWQFG